MIMIPFFAINCNRAFLFTIHCVKSSHFIDNGTTQNFLDAGFFKNDFLHFYGVAEMKETHTK